MHVDDHRMRRPALCLVVLLMNAVQGGCTSTTDLGYWGASIGWPDGQRLRESAVGAIRSPHTWAPLAGAAVLSIGDLDEEIADWAADEAPIFGSDAARASDHLRNLSTAAYFVTALAAPSDAVSGKLKGLGVGVSALWIERSTVTAMKSLAGRQRPNGSDDKSFPSGHTSRASVSAAMAAANLDYFDVPVWARRSMQIGLYGVAAGTGWARVEGEKHYPTDVLVGYGVGQFIARFMYGAFFDRAAPAGNDSQAIQFRPLPGGGELTLSLELR